MKNRLCVFFVVIGFLFISTSHSAEFLTQPTLVSPAGDISDVSPSFTWNATSSATRYLVWVNDDSNGIVATTWYKDGELGCSAGAGFCTAEPSLILGPGLYTWCVLPWNAAGFGPWSAGMSFAAQGQDDDAAKEDAARLLTQATYGATIADIEQVVGNGGPTAWVEAQSVLPASYHLPIVKRLYPDGWDPQAVVRKRTLTVRWIRYPIIRTSAVYIQTAYSAARHQQPLARVCSSCRCRIQQ